jgi:hypothetical protein
MQPFTIGWPRCWPLHGLGRNHLVRFSDRVESIVVLIFGVLVIVAIPFAVGVGGSVHDDEVADHARHAASVHQVMATVFAEPEASKHYLFSEQWSVPVRWDVGGSAHEARIDGDAKGQVGQQVPIWLDRHGSLTRSPAARGSAWADAVSVAIVVWLALVGACGGAMQLIRWRLDVSRFATWEREFESLADDDGGRTRR